MNVSEEKLDKLKKDFANKDTSAILYNDDISTINKVYLIGRILAEQKMIDKNLWYVILDLKDENLQDIIIPDAVIPYFENKEL